MDISSLTVVLSGIAVVAASVLIACNEPPLWVYLLGCAGSLPLSSALLDGVDFTSVAGTGPSERGRCGWLSRPLSRSC